jgi:hypothetical protein
MYKALLGKNNLGLDYSQIIPRLISDYFDYFKNNLTGLFFRSVLGMGYFG